MRREEIVPVTDEVVLREQELLHFRVVDLEARAVAVLVGGCASLGFKVNSI